MLDSVYLVYMLVDMLDSGMLWLALGGQPDGVYLYYITFYLHRWQLWRPRRWITAYHPQRSQRITHSTTNHIILAVTHSTTTKITVVTQSTRNQIKVVIYQKQIRDLITQFTNVTLQMSYKYLQMMFQEKHSAWPPTTWIGIVEST